MKRQHIILAAALAAAPAVSAQTLTKEIVIEREIDPTLPEAARISNFPSLVQPQAPVSRLPFVDVTAATRVPGMLSMLEPANGQPAITLSPYRGYASLGYFPAYNLGISAGYSIIAKPASSLNVWTQFDGYSYKDQYDETLKRNSVTVGADFSHLFGRTKRLDLSADFTYNAYNKPWEEEDPNHHTLAFDIDAAWSARHNALAYYVTGAFSHFGFSGKEIHLTNGRLDAVSQNIIKVAGGTAYFITDKSSVNGHVDVSFVHTGHFNTLLNDMTVGGTSIWLPALIGGDGKTMGLITLAPSYRYTSGAFSTSLGVKAQIATNSGKTFHIAPDVKINVRPVSTFAATLSFGGGEHINRLSALYNIDPYMSVAQGYKFSEVPFTADLSLTFGPFYGASVELFGGYAVANDWLMPEVLDGAGGPNPSSNRLIYGSMFNTVDLRAVRYGAKFAWKYNKNIEASVKYTGAPGSYRHSYYLNHDRARHVLEANMSVTPIAPLTVDASFELRAGRSLYTYWGTTVGSKPMKYDLLNANSLNIGATYRFTDRISAFARVENILGRRAYMYNLLEQQGIHGLIGAAVKF